MLKQDLETKNKKMDKNKEFHALAFHKWAKELLTEEQYEAVNKKAAPAAGGMAKKVNQLAKDRLEKAFTESPQSRKELGHDSTLFVVSEKGKFTKEDSEFENLADFGWEACGGCTFYLRDAGGSESGGCLAVQGDIPWFSTCGYFISGQEEAMAAFGAMRTHARTMELLTKEDDEEDPTKFTKEDCTYEFQVEFAKTDEDKRLVYGIVLAPNDIDTQDDMIFPEEIEKAAHDFLQNSRVVGTDHELVADSEVVESYIVPEDTVLEEQEVQKGTWVIVSKVHSDELWQQIKDGYYTGYSIGGTGTRIIPIEEENE